MITVIITLIACGLLTLWLVERERRIAAQDGLMRALNILHKNSDIHKDILRSNHETVSDLQRTINKQALQLASKTFEQARSLEPNAITSLRRTDAELVKISQEKSEADKREDKMYEEIGRVK